MSNASRRLSDLSPEEKRALLATLLKRASEDGVRPKLVPRAGNSSVCPLSFAQQRLWFLDQLHPDSPAYNIPVALQLAGPLDIKALQHSLRAIVLRHEALRTTFGMQDGQPVQVIAPSLNVPLPVYDLGSLQPAARAAEAQRLAVEETRRPFDLARGPLLRAALLRLDVAEHVLLLTMHHIVSDGWSMGVAVRELGALYAAHVTGRPAALPPLPVQYADYAVWQRAWLQGSGVGGQGSGARSQESGVRSQESDVGDGQTQNSKLKTQNSPLEEQLAYWKEQLAGLPTLDLPTDDPRPAIMSFHGKRHGFALPKELSTQLAALSRAEGVTLFMTLLAAWQVLLARYSEQDDIAVGTPIANRTQAETEGLIGFFINTLVLRADLSRNPPFRTALRRVREVCLGAYAHQELPFEQVVEALAPARDLSRHPLFQVLFTLQNAPLAPLELPSLSLRPMAVAGTTIKFDLSLVLVEAPDGIAGTLEYCTDLFTAATITRLLGHFQQLLEGIVAQPQRGVATLPLLSPAERAQLLYAWNATAAPYPADATLPALFAAQAARTPHAVAVVFDRGQGSGVRGQGDKKTGRPPTGAWQGDKKTRSASVLSPQSSVLSPQSLTYRELNECANRLARYLTSLGAGPETRVAVALERSLDLVVALVAVLKAGAAYVPLDPSYPPARLAFMLEDSQAAVLITTTDDRRPTTDDRRPTTDDRRPTNDQRPTTNDQRTGTIYRAPTTTTTTDDQPTTDPRSTTTDQRTGTIYRAPTTTTTTDDRRPTTDDRRPTTDDAEPGTKNQEPHDSENQEPRTDDELKTQNSKLKTHPLTPSPLHPFTASPPHLVTLSSSWSAIALCAVDDPVGALDPANLAYVIYTSGSTGLPKGAMNAHRAIVNRLHWMQAAYQLAPADRVLHKTPISFDVSIWELCWPLLYGAALVLARPGGQQDPAYLAALADTQRISIMHFVPSMLRAFLELDTLPRLPALRHLICSGEALPPDLAARCAAQLDAALHNLYGPTEAAIDVTAWTCPRTQPAPCIPIGRPIANTQCYVLDRQLEPVPIGIPGELYLGGIQLARGYLGRPDLTAERFIPNPFADQEQRTKNKEQRTDDEPVTQNSKLKTQNLRLYRTGDRARVRADGEIEYLGRRDGQVKLRGVRIEMGEIEAALAQHPAVQSCALLAREDAPGDMRLVAYLVTSDKPQVTSSAESSLVTRHSSLVTELRAFLQERLPAALIPAAFVVLEALPLLPNGKLDRAALPPPDYRAAAPRFLAPRTPTEQTLAEIWAAVLRLDRVGVTDNFFALGGDSILSLQIIAQAQRAGLRLTPRQLFQHQTVAALARVATPLASTPPAPAPVAGTVPLTPIQNWFFAQERVAPQHFNQALLLTLPQPLDAARLAQALRALLADHDALRLRFRSSAQGWTQYYSATAPLALLRMDLGRLDATTQPRALTTLATAVQTSLDLTDGPLLRIALVDLGAGQAGRLLLIAHHLVVDAVSWGILLADLQSAYTQLARGEAVVLSPPSSSYQQWAEWLAAYAQSDVLRAELDYWLAAGRQPVPRLPRDHDDGADTLATARSLEVRLEVAETRALLQEVPQAYQTRIQEVLLTALAQALGRWCGGALVRVALEGHGRDAVAAVDLTGTVGWCTTLYPVLLDLRGRAEPGAALKAVKEQLRAVPQQGLGYGVLRYLSLEEAVRAQLAALPEPEVLFNYLGQVDQALPRDGLFGLAGEGSGPAQDPQALRSHLLGVTGLIVGGQLQMRWTYSTRRHTAATIERLAADYLAALRALIAHCRSPEADGYTPSDFPKAKLRQKDLDKLVARLGKTGKKEFG